MPLTILYDDGRTEEQVHYIEVGPSVKLEDFVAILSFEINISADKIQLFHNGAPLVVSGKTLGEAGIGSDDMLIARPKNQTGHHPSSQPGFADAAESVRQRVLSDEAFRLHLQNTQPSLVEAALADPQRFALLLGSAVGAFASSSASAADPFDVESQRRIEKLIQEENIAANFESALEYHPESFGNVSMLYVQVSVNGLEVKAFVDSGAQTTIMNQKCAERCGLTRLMDTRFSGVAKGVGTGKILGRVHSTIVRIGKAHLPCSITILEGMGGPDLLLGLDMLKRHQACIDLKNNALLISGERISFLPESEIPKEEGDMQQ